MEDLEITNLVDKTINIISGRELISVSEMTDLLLDIRLLLVATKKIELTS